MNPFGGVKINKEKIAKENLNYNDIKNRIMQEIAQIRDGETKVVKWIAPREEIYQGRFINKYPEIVFELNEEYGLGFSLCLPIVSLNVMHKKISGGHGGHGVFFISNLDGGFTNKHLSILDVTPRILDILAIKSNIEFKGKSIFIR